ncbi:unnamed protein product [Moneuplotes crassus]|uniref:Uncharacterized protein n=1 Tax=Euplotes crassus TaxID=5936 RepID=A0AAD1X842_EUPCR|nr:unnamed protein product [Moneuplotes crassus]
MEDETTTIPCYRILYRIVIFSEILLILLSIIEITLTMLYYSNNIAIVIMNFGIFFMLICRAMLLCWTYLKSRFRCFLMTTKSGLALGIIVMNSFKTLSVAKLDEDEGVKLLFTNIIITNLICLLLEAGAYGVLSLKIKYLIKLPSKKDSTVKAKQASTKPFDYEQLVKPESPKENKVEKELQRKKILYIIEDNSSMQYYEGTKTSKLMSSENNDKMEEMINEIVKEEQKTSSNLFSETGSIRSYGSLANLRNQRITNNLEPGESPQFGCEIVRENSSLNLSNINSSKLMFKEELQNAHIKNNTIANIFGKKRISSFSFMGSEGSSQTSEANMQSGFTSSSKYISTETKGTPQFSAFKKSIRNKSSMKSLPSSSPFRNTLAQKAEMVKMQKSGNTDEENSKNKAGKRNSAISKRPYISISSIYTLNSGDDSRANSAILSYALQVTDQPKSQIISSPSMMQDHSSGEKPPAKPPSSLSAKVNPKAYTKRM